MIWNRNPKRKKKLQKKPEQEKPEQEEDKEVNQEQRQICTLSIENIYENTYCMRTVFPFGVGYAEDN